MEKRKKKFKPIKKEGFIDVRRDESFGTIAKRHAVTFNNRFIDENREALKEASIERARILNKRKGKTETRKCPKCKTGTLVVKTSIYGDFLGCDMFPKCKGKGKVSEVKKKKKFTKRKKKTVHNAQWAKDVKEKMIEHNQRKARGQMFQDFKRLIGD